MTAPSGVTAVPHPGLLTASLLTATLMQTLDVSIANVALPHIQGSLAATSEQMSWVLTSYLVASAVTMPLSGWLSARFGRKSIYLACVMGFTLTSMLCGLSQNLEQIVFFRVLQGMAGAALAPLSLATLLDINPPERHARAMALWTMGITLAPIMGPALGAWLTEHYTWRWVFYVNVPVGLLAFIGLSSFHPSTQRSRVPFDSFGFAMLSIAIFALQLVLDRGPTKNWFESPEICIEATCGALAAYLFVVHSLFAKAPFVNFKMFKDRNFFVGCVTIFITGTPMFAPLVLLPTLLQNMLGYPVITAGLLTAPRGIGMLLGAWLLTPLLRWFDARLVIAGGFCVSCTALSYMSGFSLQMGNDVIIWTGFIQGLGNGLAFVPLSALAFGTLSANFRADGSTVFNVTRSIGSSLGIAAATAMLVRNSQVMHARLTEHITPYEQHLVGQPDLGSAAGLLALNGRINEQATMLAYVNDFKMMFWLALVCIPLVLLFRKPGSAAPAGAPQKE